MTVKLIAIDLDDTLLQDDKTISPAVKQAVSQAQSQCVHIVLASGRPYSGMRGYIEELGLNKAGCYCISYNGGLVQHASNGEVIKQTLLSIEDYNHVSALSLHLNIHFHALTYDALYTPNRDISTYTVREAFLSHVPLIYCPIDEMNPDLMFPKMMFIDHPKVLDAAIEKIPASYHDKYTLVKSSPFFLEVLHKDVDKGAAVKFLSQQLNIQQSEVMCIGDHHNDLPMLKFAGIGVAMGNASDEIKQHAQFVTRTNQQDGVAFAIEKFLA
ncbi:sugar-phosphatase [Limnobaculum xujianqingii]|uniref:sugar-phosphatase n=1 Tax=Limnobaculum xujianqingii TaxID=2738837 RepID=UPI00112CF275|nr:sugar-phosphatase [Limnobaculum xujianqingii]